MKKIIIVDVFDVALKSLVLEYRDLFEFLNVDFRKLFPDRQIIEFSNLRYDTEHNKKLKSTDDIYTYISNKYDLDSKKIEKIMQKEIQLVFNLYIKRESLYNYVKNKEVIFINNKKYKTSIIKELLNKYGYNTDNIVTIIDELELYNYLNNMNSKYKITYISADYNHIDYCNHNDIDSVFYPKTTDIFMDYINECKVNKIGLINKKIFSKMVNLSKYTEITGVRLSIALVASKLCDDINFNIKYDFNSDKKIIGYYCLGMHLLAICSWLYNESNGKLIVFMGRDGYLPKKAIQIYNKDIKTDYLEISRKSYIPVLIKQKEDLFFLKDYINVKNCTCKDIFELIEVIISMPIKEQKRIDKKEKLNIESFTNFINDIKKYFDAEKQKEYTNTFRLYIKRIIKRDSVIFDIGYSGFPEYLIEEFIPYKLKTCFIHTRNSKAYQNSYYNRGYELSTFYKGHPKYYKQRLLTKLLEN